MNEGNQLPQTSEQDTLQVSKREDAPKSAVRWPLMWPGILSAALCIAGCLIVLWQISQDEDIVINVYPEIFLVPVFIHWIYVHYRVHATLKKLTDSSYPVGPVKVAVFSAFTGPIGFLLAGGVVGLTAQVLALLFANGPDTYEVFMKSGGLFLIVGSILLGYLGTAALNMVFAFRVYGNLSKFAVKLGLKPDIVQRWLVTTSIICPGLWYSINSIADYSTFLVFAIWQSISIILCLLSISNTCKKLSAAGLQSLNRSQPIPQLSFLSQREDKRTVTSEQTGKAIVPKDQPVAGVDKSNDDEDSNEASTAGELIQLKTQPEPVVVERKLPT